MTLLPTGDHSLFEGRPVRQCVWMFAVHVRTAMTEGTCCRGDGADGGDGVWGGRWGLRTMNSPPSSRVFVRLLDHKENTPGGFQRFQRPRRSVRLQAGRSPNESECSSPGPDLEVLSDPGHPAGVFFFSDPNLKKATSCVLAANKSYVMRAAPPRDDWCL